VLTHGSKAGKLLVFQETRIDIINSDSLCSSLELELTMSILSNIFHKIFPSSHPAVKSTDVRSTEAKPSVAKPATQPTANAAPTATASTTTSTSQVTPPQAQNIQEVDVEAMLNDKAKTAGQPLNWRSSIVDLLKLLDLDSSLQSRKELAAELGYTGDTNDSASMNIWLHRQVMNKLATNGGKVPAELRD
jgi:hypothetical protein